ncbi:hypothetical protein [Burkholderia gladioli]|uniref:hypothetical protein n=1 Tax=Burkholderia gladioli TaxID=28095 RepID=UPI000BBD0C52|nr:hypothetical protein [Burkholderia gladioli]ATF84587.1 hypothetical protein CO712_05645 [Burkholderia gladioli pv. gladioli]
MTESDALRISRQAVEDARAAVGDDRNALMEELGKAALGDREIAEAFVLTGVLILQAQQERKH